MHVEQALFASRQSAHMSGYHLCAASAALDANARRELSRWGPTHNALEDNRPFAVGVSFFSLSTGDPVIAVSRAMGAEYSDRSGQHICTWFLVVDQHEFASYSHNPFAVIEAASAAGHLQGKEPFSETLPAFELSGAAGLANRLLVDRLLKRWGPGKLLCFIDAALLQPQLFIRPTKDASWAIEVLFSLTPLTDRLLFSFTAGLTLSATRPVRVQSWGDAKQARPGSPMSRSGQVFQFDANETPPLSHPWTKQIAGPLGDGDWVALEGLLRTESALA